MSMLANPLYIIKKLQYNTVRKHSCILTGRVLDIGCGAKPYRELIQASEYFGIDAVQAVRPDVCGSCVQLAFRDNSFDSVICTEVLEHLSLPGDCLDEIKRVLKSGGHAYITAPQTWGLHYEPQDFWRFTKYGLEYLMRKAGFEIVSLERIGGIFSLIGVRLVDVLWSRLSGSLSFMGRRSAERIATGLCLGFSLGFYFLGMLADSIDKRDALGWAVVVRKP